MKNNYSEKEINIFNGVLKLARSGEDMSSLTAQKIATAAGVGKATIYDYFSSKEEIVQGAMVYSMSLQKQRFEQEMARVQDFARRMDIIYNGIIDSVQDTGSVFQLLLQAMGKERGTCNLSPEILGQVAEFVTILFSVLVKGYNQNVFSMDVYDKENEAYVLMAIVSNVFATVSRAKNRLYPLSREEIIANSYKLLVKSLS